LETAHDSGFAYDLVSGVTVVGGAEVRVGNDGQTHLISIGAPTGADSAAQILRQLASSDQVRDGSYEARLLSSGPVYLMAIWLKADDGGEDLIVPVAQRFTVVPGLEAGKIYTAGNFLAMFRPYVQHQNQDAKARSGASDCGDAGLQRVETQEIIQLGGSRRLRPLLHLAYFARWMRLGAWSNSSMTAVDSVLLGRKGSTVPRMGGSAVRRSRHRRRKSN